MSTVDLHAEILDRLGRGDDVFAAEALKEKAVLVATLLAATETEVTATTAEERTAAVLAPVDTPAEGLLAAVLPIVEYGGPRALDAIPRAFIHIARRTSLIGSERGWRAAAGVLVVGRLGWALATYALHCGRLDGLCAAWRAVTKSSSEDASTSMFADPSLRHADAFDRHAGNTYEDYKSWLAGRELILARYPLLVAELDDVFAEADFLLALRAEAENSYGVYSHGFTHATVNRFRRRLADREFAAGLASLFSVAISELDATLADAYQSVKANRSGFEGPPARLFVE